MATKIKRDALYRRWQHSYEEDTDTGMVLRPETYDFPLTRRGRSSFELKPDGRLVKRVPSATDSLDEVQGSWDLKDDNQLAFYTKSKSNPDQKMQIVSVDKDRLVLKKSS